MRARVLLAAAVALVAAAVWLWRRSSPEPERVRPSEPLEHAANAPTDERARPTLPEPASEPQPAIQRSDVQHDGTAASSEPTFKQETLRAIREAAAPLLRHCVDESVARSPEQQNDLKNLLSAVITVSVTRGQVTVRDARVTVNRVHDDRLVQCAENVYDQLRLVVPATQPDGDGVIEVGFDGT